MKLVSFRAPTDTGSTYRIGVRNDEDVLDLAASHARMVEDESEAESEEILPTDMLEFLERGDEATRTAREVLSFVNEASVSHSLDGDPLQYDRTEVELRSPVPRPNSLRDCSVYEGHLLNCRDLEPGTLPDAYYEYPVYYNGNADAIVDPEAEVVRPTCEPRFDYELEIAAVIGKAGRNIRSDNADEYIAGYTIFNDFSSRKHQMETKQLKLGPGKSKDLASGLGPCLVTSDAVDPTNLATTTRVNGETWANGTTEGMFHSWGEILEYISAGTTLYPGDVIGSGTVERGCGLELDRWLTPGDTIELEVEGIGTLRHTIVEDTDGIDF